MSFIPSISINYAKFNDLEFLDLTTTLHTNLTGNTLYPDPTPKLVDYLGLIGPYQAALMQLHAGQKGAKFERDRTRNLLEAGTRELSEYATKTTPKRPDLWAEVGFPLTKDSRQARPLALPITGFKLADGDQAQTLAASVDRQPGIYGYLWRIRPKNGPSGRFCYETLISHTPSIVIEGLDSETAYCVECAAWNDNGPLLWSDALSRFVQ